MKEVEGRKMDYKYRFVPWLWTLKAEMGIRKIMCGTDSRMMALKMNSFTWEPDFRVWNQGQVKGNAYS